MMNQNKEYEDMPVKEKKKKQELREAGMDVNGEFSMDSLKKWFRRAGGALSICAAAVCLMAVLMMPVPPIKRIFISSPVCPFRL